MDAASEQVDAASEQVLVVLVTSKRQVTIGEVEETGRFDRNWKKSNTDYDFPPPIYVGGK